jgi:hypothetical protein
MNDQFRSAVRKLDTHGVVEREEQRIAKREQQQAQADLNEAAENYRSALVAVRKSEEQAPQQVPATSVEARERGLRSHQAGAYRQYDVEKLKELQERDPATFFFRFANTSIDRA